MNLETSLGDQGEATPALIAKLLQDDHQRGEFIILSAADQIYLQASGEGDEFHVEYRNGSEAEHYYSEKKLTKSELESLMLRYLAEESNWNDGHHWAPLADLKPESGTTWDLNWS